MEDVLEIIQVLAQLLDAHEHLLDLERQKQNILIEDRIGELMPLLYEQSRLVKGISAWEKERQDRVAAYLQRQGIDPEAMTLTELIKLIPSYQEKESLKNYSERLLEVIESLRRQNEFNRQLIEQSLSYIDFTLRLVTEEPDRYATYGREDLAARQASPHHRSFFDTNA